MSNTPPRPAICNRTTDELLEDLCRELRFVACNENSLPQGERVVSHVQEVRTIHAELAARHIDCHPRMEQLAQETQWQISLLLEDCLAYPQRMPYVREPDGIRRYLRCQLCSKAERSPDAKLFWFCEGCMRRVLEAVIQHKPIAGIVLFRTYNTECRCAHANEDTVLAVDGPSYVDEVFGVCERCIRDEIERRRSK